MRWYKLAHSPQVQYFPVGDEDNPLMGDPALERQALALAKDSGIGILRDKQLSMLAVAPDGSVVGALWTSEGGYGDKYSFDVVVHPQWRRMGIGTRLAEAGRDMFDPEAWPGGMELDAVSEGGAGLARGLGLEPRGQEGGHVFYAGVAPTFQHLHLDTSGRPPQHYWRLVAHLDGQPVGYVDYSEFQDEFHVDMIFVKPESRRRGVGTALMRELDRKAREEGAEVAHGMQTDEGAALVRSLQPAQKTSRLAQTIDEIGRSYPIAGGAVGGLRVMPEVPNQGSIGSTLGEYEILPGVREVSFSLFTQMGELGFYSRAEKERTEGLAREIQASGAIAPLIVVVDREGPYILEGGHRFDALRILGVQSFPAMVVVDRDELPGAVVAWLRGRCNFAKRPAAPVTEYTRTDPDVDDEKAYEEAEHYFGIGHQDEDDEGLAKPNMIWVLGYDKEIWSSPERTPDGRWQTHGTLWGHDYCGKTWKGRYDSSSGKVSVVGPNRFYSMPSWLRHKLEREFHPTSYHVF